MSTPASRPRRRSSGPAGGAPILEAHPNPTPLRLLDDLRRRILPSQAEEDADPLRWRERVLSTILAVALALGALTAAPSLWLAWRDGMYSTVAVDLAALAALVALTFDTRLSFRVRAHALLTIDFLLGVWFLGVVGPVSIVYLMSVPVLAALLLGLRPGFIALGLSTVAVGVAGFFLNADVVLPAHEATPVVKWALIALNFAFVVAVLTISSAVLLGRLARSLSREERAVESLERLARAVEQSHEGILIAEPDGAVVYENRATATVLGVRCPDGAPRRLQELAADADDPEALPAAMRGERDWRGMLRLRRPESEARLVEVEVTPLRDERGRLLHFAASVRDVTREQAMEERLRQGQKLEAIGTLAGGIAHDFNNVLTVITNYGELVRAALPPGSEAERDQREILDAAARAARLTRQLLAFGRRQILQPKRLDLNQSVRGAHEMLARLLPSHVQISLALDPALAPVHADPVQIEQVLVNLALNAADAMPGGGLLTFRTRAGVAAEPGPEGSSSGEPVACLLVSDTGVGMDTHTVARVFEPFFTTKPLGKGTGLGLASVHGIVAQLGGRIRVQSAPGAGTTFEICFPTADGPLEPTSAPSALPAAPPRAAGTVLLVDDDPAIRAVTQRVLERQGFAVRTANHGADALALLEIGNERVDLLISDVMMPGLTGLELAMRVGERWPRLPVILISGYSDVELRKQYEGRHHARLLQKPFSARALVAAIDDVLGTAAGA